MTSPRRTTSSTRRLANDNCAFLHQGIDFLENLTDAQYVHDYSPALSDGIGSHVRHIVDHYGCFFSGLEGGCINYDERRRDGRISADRSMAVNALRGLIEQLQRVGELDDVPDVVVEQNGSEGKEGKVRTQSSVERELQFLMSHTVHHYALLAIATRLAGRELVTGFGVSPSTLRYQESLQ